MGWECRNTSAERTCTSLSKLCYNNITCILWIRPVYLNLPRLLQNSPSMPSGLAVGIWVRPVRIRTSLFFRELWSIGCMKRGKVSQSYKRSYRCSDELRQPNVIIKIITGGHVWPMTYTQWTHKIIAKDKSWQLKAERNEENFVPMEDLKIWYIFICVSVNVVQTSHWISLIPLSPKVRYKDLPVDVWWGAMNPTRRTLSHGETEWSS